jgi:murein DD-endopeptidase MepM/ murein hydrolase activator NlpD
MAAPIKGKPISTAYHKAGKHWSTGYHTGIDMACPVGTEVFAAQDGTVCPGGWGSAYGTAILIDQAAIEGPPRIAGGWAIYAHLSKVFVKAGDKVKKGDKIGLSGNTGNSTGPHLHYEVRNQQRWTGGKDQDPMPFYNL